MFFCVCLGVLVSECLCLYLSVSVCTFLYVRLCVHVSVGVELKSDSSSRRVPFSLCHCRCRCCLCCSFLVIHSSILWCGCLDEKLHEGCYFVDGRPLTVFGPRRYEMPSSNSDVRLRTSVFFHRKAKERKERVMSRLFHTHSPLQLLEAESLPLAKAVLDGFALSMKTNLRSIRSQSVHAWCCNR